MNALTSLSEVRPVSTAQQDHPVGFLAHRRANPKRREMRAMLEGNIPFPGEPFDVTSKERAALWEGHIRAREWWSFLLWWHGRGMSRMVALALVPLGLLFAWGMARWFPEPHIAVVPAMLLAAASVFAWGILGKFGDPVLTRVGTKGTDVLYRFHRVLRKMTGRNLNMHALLEIQFEWGSRHHGNPILHDALGMVRDNLDFPKRLGAADLVALMRLTERLKAALPLSSAGVRVDIDGETEELLHRVCEACGMQPHEMLRVRQDGLRV